MGLFDKVKSFQETRRSRRIEKASKLIKNPKAIREDRWAALIFLAEDLDSPSEAIPALLPRFEYSLEHGINDTREKELTLKGIIKYQEHALPYLRDWLRSTYRIAWPIKAIKAVGNDETIIESLKQALKFDDVTFDQAAIDKNYDILCYLREYPLEGYLKEISHFLNDSDERVRFAAAEAMIEQKSDEAKSYLSQFLKDETVENRRIKQAVINAYIENHWIVEAPEEFSEGKVSDGIYVNKKGLLELRA